VEVFDFDKNSGALPNHIQRKLTVISVEMPLERDTEERVRCAEFIQNRDKDAEQIFVSELQDSELILHIVLEKDYRQMPIETLASQSIDLQLGLQCIHTGCSSILITAINDLLPYPRSTLRTLLETASHKVYICITDGCPYEQRKWQDLLTENSLDSSNFGSIKYTRRKQETEAAMDGFSMY